jgi:hypothetical protein
MKKIKLASIALVAILTYNLSSAQAIKTPQPSTTQKITQDFGVGTIDLSYSRPNANGRKIFGDLVPFGKMWRTGANTATRLKFSHDVTFAGQPLKAGEYSLFTIPNQNAWTIILNTDAKIKGVFEYKKEDDVLTAEVPSEEMIKMPVIKLKKGEMAPVVKGLETFTMQFANMSNNKCELHIMWENTSVKIPITVNFDADVMKQIEKVMAADTRPYNAAALYYLDNDKDLDKALEWFNKAEMANPKAYWIKYNKARCLNKLGKKAEALETSKASLELAKTADNQDYVKMNEKLIAELSK